MGDGNQLPLPDDMYHAFCEMVLDVESVDAITQILHQLQQPASG